MKKITLLFSALLVLSSCSSAGAPDDSLGGSPNEASNTSQDLSADNQQNNAGINETELSLNVPAGFKISEFVTGVSGARVLAGPDLMGNYWLSRTDEGIVSLLEVGQSGEVQNVQDIFRDLNNPHGIALSEDGLTIFIAEEDKVSRVALYSDVPIEKLVDLPDGGRHYTRTLLLGSDSRLYVSIGSTCNVCEEADAKHAAVYVMDQDGANFEKFAGGLRNAVFMRTDPVFADIWVTEMGRDFLGDDLPPDELNVLKEGADYGWPYCYGNRVRDMRFKPEVAYDCEKTEPAKIELQAHSAPLGLDFVPEEGWPQDMRLDLIVAYHGSWNRSVPTGYKLLRFELDSQRKLLNRVDFISGWLSEEGEVLGRPVDVIIQPGGVMFVTDDERGVVYKIEYSS